MRHCHCVWNGIAVVVFVSICLKVDGFHKERSILSPLSTPPKNRGIFLSRSFCSHLSRRQSIVTNRIGSLIRPDLGRPSSQSLSTGKLALDSWRQDPNDTSLDGWTPEPRWGFSKFFLRVHEWWNQLQKLMRAYWERYTIYVLECQGGKYYVGMTSNRKRRWQQHSRGDGSAWTQKYPPIQLWKEYRRIPQRYALGLEAQVTAELMWDLGVNNVRGAMFAQTRAFHQGDVDTLVQFLGHYNGLPYRKVRQVLQASLPPVPSEPIIDGQRLQRMTSFANRIEVVGPAKRKCYQCGKYGHFAANCPTSSIGTSRKKCFRCGRYGHIASDCTETFSKPNTKSANELPLICDYCAQMGHTSEDCPLL